MKIQERYTPILVGINGTVIITTSGTGGFLCKAAGTFSLSRYDEITGLPVLVVDGHPATAGTYYPLPFHLGITGGIFTAAGGASGTLGV